MRWNMSPKRYYELQDTTCHSEWGKLSHQIPIKIDSILLTSLYCFEDQVILFMYVPVHVHVYSWVYCVFKCTCMCVHLPMEARGRPQVSSSGHSLPLFAFLEPGSCTDLELADYVRVVGHGAPVIHQSLSP